MDTNTSSRHVTTRVQFSVAFVSKSRVNDLGIMRKSAKGKWEPVEKVNTGWRLPLSNPSSHYRASTIDASIRSMPYFFHPPVVHAPSRSHHVPPVDYSRYCAKASRALGRAHSAGRPVVNLLSPYRMWQPNVFLSFRRNWKWKHLTADEKSIYQA